MHANPTSHVHQSARRGLGQQALEGDDASVALRQRAG